MTLLVASSRRRFLVQGIAALVSVRAWRGGAQDQHVPASTVPSSELVQPAALAASLREGGAKPVMLQVGSHVLFAEAHIPGSEYVGAAGQDAGLELLKQRVAKLAKDTPIVLYCGCCPWERCPNIARGYNLLRADGFTGVKALYLAHSFGADWVDQGYPVSKGR